jgi:hypothetical protein
MRNSMFTLTNWFTCNPRRALVIVLVVLMVLALTLAIVPGGAALGAEITSGS